MILYERCCEWVMNGDHLLGIFNWFGGILPFFIGIIRMDAMKVFCF